MDISSDTSSTTEDLSTLIEGCRLGRALIVAASLIEMSKKRRKEVLTTQTAGENYQLYTPFLLSVKNGHIQLARLLLTMFSINPNDICHAGNVSFDGYLVEGATPLWSAAAIGSFEIVKLLVEHDAEINECTRTNSSPLRAACFCGNMQIVEFLIEKGADMSIANLYKNTCLMVASYRGHLDIVEYLLEKGAQPDVQDNSKCTALHFAVDGAQLRIVKELVRKGANMRIVNENGLTAPMSAADSCDAELVNFFCSLDSISMPDKITLLELLGASFANDKDHYDIERTYHFLCLAILMREKANLPKKILPPEAAYLSRKECETKDDLEDIRNDLDSLHLESLIVRERVLGSDNIEVPHPIVYRGAVYADRLQFSRSISLWQRALDLKQKNGRDSCSDLYRFAEVFSQMVMLREKIDVDALAAVMESCLSELKVSRAKLKEAERNLTTPFTCSSPSIPYRGHMCPHTKMSPEQKVQFHQAQLEGNLHVMLYLLFIVTKSTKASSEAEAYQCGKIIYRFVKLDFRDSRGRTPLHKVLDESTPVDDFHVKDVCSFPNSEISRLLLLCGADPNATCDKGNTPLHVIVQYAKPISDYMTLQTAIVELLEAGAHPDTRNRKRQSPLDLATTGVAEIILKKGSKLSLKCIAARVVRKYSIPYEQQVPLTLEKFIEKH